MTDEEIITCARLAKEMFNRMHLSTQETLESWSPEQNPSICMNALINATARLAAKTIYMCGMFSSEKGAALTIFLNKIEYWLGYYER